MESLALIHTALEHESETPELTVLESGVVSGPGMVGVAGAIAAISVLGGAPNMAQAATTPVGPGSAGAEVEAIQQALGIEVDGQYGDKTTTAVTDFQIRQGLSDIDGVVGQDTAAALGLDEAYRPVGYVDTYYDVGLNIRQGPGTGYYIVGGADEGAYLYQDYEDVVYNNGYVWTPLYTGGWVASDYTQEYYPVSYGGYEDVSYDDGYSDCYDNSGYYPVSYGDNGGYVETNYEVGLNVRSGPGLDYRRVGGASEGAYVGTGGEVIYRDGYAWQQTDGGGWVATDYLY